MAYEPLNDRVHQTVSDILAELSLGGIDLPLEQVRTVLFRRIRDRVIKEQIRTKRLLRIEFAGKVDTTFAGISIVGK